MTFAIPRVVSGFLSGPLRDLAGYSNCGRPVMRSKVEEVIAVTLAPVSTLKLTLTPLIEMGRLMQMLVRLPNVLR